MKLTFPPQSRRKISAQAPALALTARGANAAAAVASNTIHVGAKLRRGIAHDAMRVTGLRASVRRPGRVRDLPDEKRSKSDVFHFKLAEILI